MGSSQTPRAGKVARGRAGQTQQLLLRRKHICAQAGAVLRGHRG